MRSRRANSRGSNGSSAAAALARPKKPARRSGTGMRTACEAGRTSSFGSEAERMRNRPDSDADADAHRGDLEPLTRREVVAERAADEERQSFERDDHQTARGDEREHV